MHSIHLSVWEEAVGRLEDICLRDGRLYVTLAEVGIVMMPFCGSQLTRFQRLKGRHIAILRTDNGEREFLVRAIETRGSLNITDTELAKHR